VRCGKKTITGQRTGGVNRVSGFQEKGGRKEVAPTGKCQENTKNFETKSKGENTHKREEDQAGNRSRRMKPKGHKAQGGEKPWIVRGLARENICPDPSELFLEAGCEREFSYGRITSGTSAGKARAPDTQGERKAGRRGGGPGENAQSVLRFHNSPRKKA